VGFEIAGVRCRRGLGNWTNEQIRRVTDIVAPPSLSIYGLATLPFRRWLFGDISSDLSGAHQYRNAALND
jgi:hypothetical protein